MDLDLREALEPCWFRVEARHYASVNDYGEVTSRSSYLEIIEYAVIRHTPKGVWLNIGFGGSKFVLRELQHRARAFAAPTEEQAKTDFRLRKEYRLLKLEAQIRRTKAEIALLDWTGTVQRTKG